MSTLDVSKEAHACTHNDSTSTCTSIQMPEISKSSGEV